MAGLKIQAGLTAQGVRAGAEVGQDCGLGWDSVNQCWSAGPHISNICIHYKVSAAGAKREVKKPPNARRVAQDLEVLRAKNTCFLVKKAY